MNVLGLPSAEQFEEQISVLRDISGKMGVIGTIGSWKDVQAIVRRGTPQNFFKDGDLLVGSYKGGTSILEVIGINHDTPTDGSLYSLTVQFRDCIENVVFDAPEAVYYANNAEAPGTKIFELDSGKYQFTSTVEIPAGGVVYLSSWTDPYTPTRARIYAADRVTILEDNLTVTTSTGTNNLTPVNHQQRCRYGSNNYLQSNIRQWLNSDRETFQWVPQTNFDMPTLSGAYAGGGFLNVIDPELAEVIGAVDKQVGRNTVTDGGGQDTFSDKVFLLSQVEVYGGTSSAGVTDGEAPYAYYENLAAEPTTDVVPGRIKLLDGLPRNWRLRSPSASDAYHARGVNSTGRVHGYGAYGARGAAPACVII